MQSFNTGSEQRILQYLIVLFVAITLNFALPRIMPGDPVALISGIEIAGLSAEDRLQLTENLGLDIPLHQQYLNYLGDLALGDFGYSYRQKQPIADIILARLPYTLLLTLSALFLSAIIGILLGALAAWQRGRFTDMILFNGMIIIDSLPSFWLGMIFIAIFAVQLNWFPSQGAITAAANSEGVAHMLDLLHHATLPVFTLMLLSLPRVFLTMRNAMLGDAGSEYVRTARAKGLTSRQIILRHMIPNALLPVVTVLALRFGFAFGGTVVIETVFSYPGLGRLVFEAVHARDYPVMQAAFLLFTIAVLLSNLVVDWLYPVLDPRARSQAN